MEEEDARGEDAVEKERRTSTAVAALATVDVLTKPAGDATDLDAEERVGTSMASK